MRLANLKGCRHIGGHGKGSTFFCGLRGANEFTRGGRDSVVFQVKRQVYSFVRNEENSFGDIFVGFFGLVAVKPFHDFLERKQVIYW